MRNGVRLSVICLFISTTTLKAQERIPLPPPDSAAANAEEAPPPTQAGPATPYTPPPPTSVPSAGPLPNYQATPPPGMYTLPPGGMMAQPYPPAAFLANPANPFFWIGAEGLVWWMQNQPLSVPLLTTGPASQGGNAGNLGAPGTVSLNSPLNLGAAVGLRVFAGGWLNSCQTIGMDGSIFFLQQLSAGFGAVDRSGTGQFVINEPVAGAPFSTQVSSPGIETGSANVNATSNFGGGDINALFNLYRAANWNLTLLGGFRYLQLDENLDILANSNLFVTTVYTDNFGNVLANAPPGSSVSVYDHFGTRNEFYGGQLGVRFNGLMNRWVLNGAVKVALGDTHEVVNINGNTTVFPINGTPVPLAGGNYATLQSGSYAVDRFAVAPEVQLGVGYQFTPCTRAMIGYNFLLLSNVLRPGNQIDNTYDGVVHPDVPLTSSSFWAQGLTFSLQFNF